MQRLPPAHVHSGELRNTAAVAIVATVTYTMPDDTTQTAEVRADAGQSAAIEQKLVEQGSATFTGRVSTVTVAAEGAEAVTVAEPFEGVVGPVKNFPFVVAVDGGAIKITHA